MAEEVTLDIRSPCFSPATRQVYVHFKSHQGIISHLTALKTGRVRRTGLTVRAPAKAFRGWLDSLEVAVHMCIRRGLAVPH